MRFNSKVILSGFTRADGTQGVYLQAIINRKRAIVSLGFFVPENQFVNGRVRSSFPNSDLLNLEIGKALGRAHEIASEYRLSDRFLTPDIFRQEFSNPINKSDFIQFARQELELRKSKIDFRTYQQNLYALDKISKFKSRIQFAELTVELLQRYHNFEVKEYENQENTINKTFTTWKLYLNAAKRKGIKFNNPFDHFKLSKIKPHKVSLSQLELETLVKYYQSAECKETHRHTLRYFLFSCANGIRISDISLIKWEHINDGVLTIMPQKTRRKKKVVQIPLSDFEVYLLPNYKASSASIFDCYAHPVTNRYLKEIARECKIKKSLTYHMSRHTFATLFLERGGGLDVLQDLLGHSEISTTMIYAHLSDKRKLLQKKEVFDNIIPVELNVSI